MFSKLQKPWLFLRKMAEFQKRTLFPTFFQVYIAPVALKVPGGGKMTWQAFDSDDTVSQSILKEVKICSSVSEAYPTVNNVLKIVVW
jgi:hypothetical protein